MLLDGYRAAIIPTILRTDEVPNDAYLSGGFEHGLYQESIMAQMYDDSKRSGALARGKAYIEILQLVKDLKYTLVQGHSAVQLLLADTITKKHNLATSRTVSGMESRIRNHIHKMAKQVALLDNFNACNVPMIQDLALQIGSQEFSRERGMEEFIKRLVTSSNTSVQRFLDELYNTLGTESASVLPWGISEIPIDERLGVRKNASMRVFRIVNHFVILSNVTSMAYVVSINYLEHLRSVTAWNVRGLYLWKVSCFTPCIMVQLVVIFSYYLYFQNYRKVGAMGTVQGDAFKLYKTILKRIAALIYKGSGDENVARQVKAVQFILFTSMNESSSGLNTGARDRVEKLERDYYNRIWGRL